MDVFWSDEARSDCDTILAFLLDEHRSKAVGAEAVATRATPWQQVVTAPFA